MKLTLVAIIYQLLLEWSSSISTVSTQTSCYPITEEYALCDTLGGRGSTYFFPQNIPAINKDIEGHNINIGFIIFRQFDPPPPPECIDAARHVVCIVAAPSCLPETGLPLVICSESCEAYNKLLAVDYCRVLDDHIHAVKTVSTFPDLLVLVDKYFEFKCDVPSTYLFDSSITEYSNESCTQLFEQDTLEQILSRPSCLRVPAGPCSNLSETGYYISEPGDRDATVVSQIVNSFESNDNSSSQSSCQTALLKLACDFYYPPCDRYTFQQRAICNDSCKSVSLIQSVCQSVVGNVSLLNDILLLDCKKPVSYAVRNVSVSQNKCINLTAYAINLPVQSKFDTEPLAIGLSISLVALVVVVVCTLIIIAGCCLRIRKKEARSKFSNIISARYSIKDRSGPLVELHYVGAKGKSDNDFLMLLKTVKESYISQFSSILVPYANILMAESIGEGAFGKVYKGKLLVACEGSDKTESSATVAIKTIKHLTSQEELKSFFSESLIMKDFDHPNVLGLAGVCFDTPDGYPFLILPFMVNGSLKSYLKKRRRHVTDVDSFPEGLELPVLVRMCMDIACGMEYLSEKKFVHRDLAARNCMVDDDLKIKVGDFGLARDVYSSDYYRANRNTKLPVKWMSPEAIHDRISSEKTDVWSFGVTCWELFSLGRSPYPSISNYELVFVISSGAKLEKPNLCPSTLYNLISHCWELLPGDRPTFAELNSELSDYWEEHFAYS